MKICEIKILLKINEKWENSFKGDLLENIFEEYEDIKLFCKVFTKDWIPCWKSENKEHRELYDSLKLEVDKLNKNLLQEEYLIIRELYIYQQDLENCFATTTLNDVVKWIDSMFDEDEEITFELLRDTLDEHIYHYGTDS